MIRCKNCLHPVRKVLLGVGEVWGHEGLNGVGGSKCPHPDCACTNPEYHPDDYKPVYLREAPINFEI
jgi:hypothetical protein